jgi:hypothetical protein
MITRAKSSKAPRGLASPVVCMCVFVCIDVDARRGGGVKRLGEKR